MRERNKIIIKITMLLLNLYNHNLQNKSDAPVDFIEL